MIKYEIYTWRMKENIEKYRELGNVYYAAKANSYAMFFLKDVPGLGFAISNYSQAKSAIEDGIQPSRLFVINTTLRERELIELHDCGIRKFTLNSLDKFRLLLSKGDCEELEVCVRIDFPGYKNSLINCSTTEAIEIVAMAKEYNLNGTGISLYRPDDNFGYNRKLSSLLSKFDGIDFINLGGIDKYSNCEIDVLKSSGKRLNLEVGSGIVNDAIITTSDIIKVDRESGVKKPTTYIITEIGIYSGLYDINKYPDRDFGMELNIEDWYFKLTPESKTPEIQRENLERVVIYGGSGNYDDFIGVFYTNNQLGFLSKYYLCKGKLILNKAGAYSTELITQYQKEADYSMYVDRV